MNPARRLLQGRRDLLALASAQPRRYPGLLESVADGTGHARYDVLFAFPEAELRLDVDGRVRDADDNVHPGRFLEVLDAAWEQARTPHGPSGDPLPFAGGWLLYLGYELSAEVEPRLRLPQPSAVPLALALRCPVAVIVDHATTPRSSLLSLATSTSSTGLKSICMRSIDRRDQATCRVRRGGRSAALSRWRCTHPGILRAGDVFQVNLSREWRIELAEPVAPAMLYAALRRVNPSPFAGLLQWRDFAIASSSPERLVETRGRQVQTRPIAGTRARVEGEDSAARIRELLGHPKERAEHVMLIDLERNDLGRVCVPGSIEVDEMMRIESYAHVHHIVSNVRGRLRDDVTPGEVIRAVFPGGTITGCPKVRCMEIIAELEQCARGPYTGSLGYLGRNGDLDLNILIRTLTVRGSAVSLRAGAGIVIDSDALAELAETRAKARGLLRAFGVEP